MTDDPLHRIRATVAILDLRRWGAQLDEFAVFDGFTDEQLVKFLILDAARLLDQMTSDEPWVEFLRTRSEGGRVTGRPVVYVAGPYSQGDPVENVGAAVHLASMLMDRGWAWPLVPHLTHLWHLIAPRPHRDWIDLDLALLARCDGLVRLPGASAGADVEVIWCVERGVPVHHLPLAWGSTTALARLRSWLDEVEEVIHAR